jgi:hypothetical protein
MVCDVTDVKKKDYSDYLPSFISGTITREEF